MTHFDLIRAWAADRNIIVGGTPQAQLNKLMEEVGELAHGVNKNRIAEIKDSIGDAIVVMVIMAAQYSMTVEECIAAAWDEIKDRKGKMIDGIFVKEEDL